MKPFFESGCNNPTDNRIAEILSLVGPAVLLPLPTRSKGDRRRWGHLQLTDMGETDHLAKLEKAGNIGVALGKVSNGLVTIDLDQDRYVDIFLGANPTLSNTLRTRGRRGCNIWLRCSCEYPRSQKIKNDSGTAIGEWRADNHQTIICGTHPDGMPYQFVVKQPAITISYDAIIWPESMRQPSFTFSATEGMRVKGVREYEVVGSVCDNASQALKLFINSDLISQIAPKDYRQNHDSLFKLARLVKSCQDEVNRPATVEEKQVVFDRWCIVSRPFWRHTKDDYWAEFLEACHYAHTGLDHDPLEVALSRARNGPLPVVPGFTDERVRLLAGTCREMDVLVGEGPFFLPTRKTGAFLGADHSAVARWLVALEELGIIHLAPGERRIRGGMRSPRYCYGPRVRNDAKPPMAISNKALVNATPAA